MSIVIIFDMGNVVYGFFVFDMLIGGIVDMIIE